MSFSGGDILEVSYKHPTEGTGTWFVKSNEDSNQDAGGYRSEDDANMITGDGQTIDKMNRVRWSQEFVIAWDMGGNDELAQARRLAASPVPADWTFTHISGVIYGAKGKPVGDLVGNTNAATFPVKISGGGTIEKIS